jgi:hypothetical protein
MQLDFEDYCTVCRFVEISTGSCLYARYTKLQVAESEASPAEYINDFGVQHYRLLLPKKHLLTGLRILRHLYLRHTALSTSWAYSPPLLHSDDLIRLPNISIQSPCRPVSEVGNRTPLPEDSDDLIRFESPPPHLHHIHAEVAQHM